MKPARIVLWTNPVGVNASTRRNYRLQVRKVSCAAWAACNAGFPSIIGASTRIASENIDFLRMHFAHSLDPLHSAPHSLTVRVDFGCGTGQ